MTLNAFPLSTYCCFSTTTWQLSHDLTVNKLENHGSEETFSYLKSIFIGPLVLLFDCREQQSELQPKR